jgi:hypothetical protein
MPQRGAASLGSVDLNQKYGEIVARERVSTPRLATAEQGPLGENHQPKISRALHGDRSGAGSDDEGSRLHCYVVEANLDSYVTLADRDERLVSRSVVEWIQKGVCADKRRRQRLLCHPHPRSVAATRAVDSRWHENDLITVWAKTSHGFHEGVDSGPTIMRGNDGSPSHNYAGYYDAQNDDDVESGITTEFGGSWYDQFERAESTTVQGKHFDPVVVDCDFAIPSEILIVSTSRKRRKLNERGKNCWLVTPDLHEYPRTDTVDWTIRTTSSRPLACTDHHPLQVGQPYETSHFPSNPPGGSPTYSWELKGSDALIGKGHPRNTGSIALRELVMSFQSRFSEASLPNKHRIVREVIDCWHRRGGRFMERAGKRFSEVCDETVSRKLFERLRDQNRPTRRRRAQTRPAHRGESRGASDFGGSRMKKSVKMHPREPLRDAKDLDHQSPSALQVPDCIIQQDPNESPGLPKHRISPESSTPPKSIDLLSILSEDLAEHHPTPIFQSRKESDCPTSPPERPDSASVELLEMGARDVPILNGLGTSKLAFPKRSHLYSQGGNIAMRSGEVFCDGSQEAIFPQLCERLQDLSNHTLQCAQPNVSPIYPAPQWRSPTEKPVSLFENEGNRHDCHEASLWQSRLRVYDVVLGQGGCNYDCKGNIQFREIVVPRYAPKYKSAKKGEKREVALEVFFCWRTAYPSSRFVARLNDCEVTVVSLDRACVYISERLRDFGRKSSPGCRGNQVESLHGTRVSSDNIQTVLHHLPFAAESILNQRCMKLLEQLWNELVGQCSSDSRPEENAATSGRSSASADATVLGAHGSGCVVDSTEEAEFIVDVVGIDEYWPELEQDCKSLDDTFGQDEI